MVNENSIKSIFSDAIRAGQVAMENAIPEAMMIHGGARTYLVEGGVCGFGWVNIYGVRSNSKLGKALIQLGCRRDSYTKSLSYWISDGGQSMERKEAYAHAMARVLQDAGLRAYGNSRMD